MKKKFLGNHKDNVFNHRRKKSIRDDLVKPEDLSPELRKMLNIVIAKCIGCGNKREIKAGEIPNGDYPCCDKCGMPMIAEKAIRK